MLLIEPTLEYAKDIEAYRQEFLDIEGSMDGCGSLRRCATGAEWIEKCRLGKDPATVPAHLVPATQFIYVREEDGRVVGMLQIRHYFNEYLEKYAGHIGYSVRPSERRKGYAAAADHGFARRHYDVAAHRADIEAALFHVARAVRVPDILARKKLYHRYIQRLRQGFQQTYVRESRAGLPLAHRLAADMDPFGKFRLRHPFAFAELFYHGSGNISVHKKTSFFQGGGHVAGSSAVPVTAYNPMLPYAGINRVKL